MSYEKRTFCAGGGVLTSNQTQTWPETAVVDADANAGAARRWENS